MFAYQRKQTILARSGRGRPVNMIRFDVITKLYYCECEGQYFYTFKEVNYCMNSTKEKKKINM